MPTRALKILDQLTRRLASAPKKMQFSPASNFSVWSAQFKMKIEELLGSMPDPVPLNMEIVEEEYIEDYEELGIQPYYQQKILYDSEAHASVDAYLLIPASVHDHPDHQVPAILNAHGHGMGNKKLVNLDPKYWSEEGVSFEASAIHLMNGGFVVLAPDWRGFGDRKLDEDFRRKGRDSCNVNYLSFGYFGYNLLALNVFDAQRSLDLLQTLPFVDGTRLGMVGKSYGGTLTAYTSAIDDRIKAAVVSGYLSTLEDAFSPHARGNFCGAQYLPGLLEWGDIPDVIGLICPRPLLIEAGICDDCFEYSDATKAFTHLQKIYRAGNASAFLERDTAEVAHEYIFHRMVPFLQQYLA